MNELNKNLPKKDIAWFECLFNAAIELLSEKELIPIVAQEIAPFIRSSELFNVAKEQWLQEGHSYLQKKQYLRVNSESEIESDFNELIALLREAQLITHPLVAKQISEVEYFLSQKHCDTAYWYVDFVDTNMQSLLSILLALGAEEIVRKYTILKVSTIPMNNFFTGRMEVNAKYIWTPTYAPSLRERRAMENLFRGSTHIKEAWIAWEIISFLEWCWNEDGSSFNEHQVENIAEIRKHWDEINSIRHGDYSPDHSFLYFSRDRLIACLRLISAHIFPRSQQPSAAKVPMMAKLWLYETRMASYILLDIYWSDLLEKPDTLKIHKFVKETPELKLLRQLLQKPGEIVDVRIFGGQSVARSLGRMKLKNILGSQIFDSLGNKKSYYIALRSQTINRLDIRKDEEGKFCNYVLSLPRYKPLF